MWLFRGTNVGEWKKLHFLAKSAPCMRPFVRSCSSVRLSPRADEVEGRKLGSWGNMLRFFESFKSFLVPLVLVQTAVLPTKASKDPLDLLTRAQSSAVLGALSCKALTSDNKESVPFSSFPSRAAKVMSMSQQVKTQETISPVFVLHSHHWELFSGSISGICLGKSSCCKIQPCVFK